MGEYSTTTNQNPVMISSNAIDSVTVYSGETQSFYIARTDGQYFIAREESSGSSSTNADVTLYTGLIKSSRELFASANVIGRFQGTMHYSKAIDP